MSKKFPDGFYWGAATASYQVEGGIENCDWAEAGRNGKVPRAGIACDHYHRYEEDFDIAKSLHHNAHRFSVEWARVEPEEGKFDEKEIAHYRNVVSALRARGIEPFLTVWHFTLPQWFVDSGAFNRKDAHEIFARYAAKVAEVLPDVTYISTINEPMVWISVGHIDGRWPPFKKNPFLFFTLGNAMIRAHKAAYTAIKKVRPEAKVGYSKHMIWFEGRGIIGRIVAPVASWFWDGRFLDATKNHIDYLGMNHYFRLPLWLSQKKRDAVPTSDLGWELYPPAIYHCLMRLKRYGKPIHIDENGLADATDSRREWFIKETLSEVHRAIQDGAPVVGYKHWSLLDNYEWAEGYTPRFGLVHIDYDNNQKRTIRESAKAYAEICKNNAL